REATSRRGSASRRESARSAPADPGTGPTLRRSVGRRPGLLLDHEVAFDRKDAAPCGEVEQLDQARVDVELRAVLAESARDAEAQPLAPVRQPERRVEPGRDEPGITGGATGAGGDGAVLA